MEAPTPIDILPERDWPRVAQLFDRAVEMPAAQQRALLREPGVCPRIRRQVESLLASDRRAASCLQSSAFDSAAQLLAEDLELKPGHKLGAFQVVRRLGGGGMGTVYLARRCDQRFRQEVAVKVLHGGLKTPEMQQLFRHERQILADLEHPAIARLIDGGELEDGRPYLVMERVEGRCIDRYCNIQGLSTVQRIRLMVEVCEGVSAAHRQLVVHRDLKPSNILVTDEGRPKLVDFGTAKLLDQGPVATGQELVFSTPVYASPEQAPGQAATVGNDVYSLGVVLFQLLHGRLPQPPAKDDPRHVAARQETEHRRLPAALRAILRRAMATDPQQRYPNVDGLTRDLRAFLARRPVEAHAAPAWHPVWLLVRRHPWGSLLASAALALLCLFVLALDQQRDRAQEALQRAEQASTFAEGLFAAAAPEHSHGQPLTASAMLERGRQQLDQGSFEPALRQRISNGLARRYLELGNYEQAAQLLSTGADPRERHVSLVEDAETTALLGRVALRQGRWPEAAAMLEEALEQLASGSSSASRQTIRVLTDLAETRGRQGRIAEADGSLAKAMELSSRLLSEQDPELGRINAIAGFLAYERNDLASSEHHHQRALELATQRGGRLQPAVADALGDLALVYRRLGRSDDALHAGREALDIQERIFSPGHPAIAVGYFNLGSLSLASGHFADARQLLEVALAREEQIAAVDPMAPARGFLLLAHAFFHLGNGEQAEVLARSAIELETAATDGAARVRNRLALARAQATYGSWAEAQLGFQQALAEAPDTATRPWRLLATYARELLRRDEAQLAARWLAPGTTTAGIDAAARQPPLWYLAQAELAATQGQWSLADRQLRNAADRMDPDPDHPQRADLEISRAAILRAMGDHDAAIAAARKAMDIALLRAGPDGPLAARARLELGAALLQAGQATAARPQLEQATLVLPAGNDYPTLGGPAARQLLAQASP